MLTNSDTQAPEQPELSPYIGPGVAFVCVALFMVAPMLIVDGVNPPVEGSSAMSGAAATVAIGAMLRTSGRAVLRSTFMGAARTMSRALTRRVVRSFLPMMMRLFLPAFRLSALENDDSAPAQRAQPLWWSIGLGMLTLGLSFCGVIYITGDDSLLSGLSALEISCLATVPLLLHLGLFLYFGKITNVRIELRTALDGVLLQGYFTGAGSYLPLASDIEMEGTERDKGVCSAMVLCSFLVVYAVLELLGILIGSYWLTACAAQILLYAFVLSFPLPPLDGSDVWAHSRWAWLFIWLATLLMFLGRMPESFYGIL